jgi:hypothetical protein
MLGQDEESPLSDLFVADVPGAAGGSPVGGDVVAIGRAGV